MFFYYCYYFYIVSAQFFLSLPLPRSTLLCLFYLSSNCRYSSIKLSSLESCCSAAAAAAAVMAVARRGKANIFKNFEHHVAVGRPARDAILHPISFYVSRVVQEWDAGWDLNNDRYFYIFFS